MLDAISFVLGVRSSHLRGAALSDLVYKPSTIEQEIEQEERRDEHKAVGRGGKGDEGEEEEEEEEKEERKEGSARSGAARDAYVEVVYSLSGEEELKLFPPASRPHDELRFRRSISRSGASVYRLNGVVMTWEEYSAELKKLGVSVKAKELSGVPGRCRVHRTAQSSSDDRHVGNRQWQRRTEGGVRGGTATEGEGGRGVPAGG